MPFTALHVPYPQPTVESPGGSALEVRALTPTGSSENTTAPIKRRKWTARHPSCRRNHPRGHVYGPPEKIFGRQHSVSNPSLMVRESSNMQRNHCEIHGHDACSPVDGSLVPEWTPSPPGLVNASFRTHCRLAIWKPTCTSANTPLHTGTA